MPVTPPTESDYAPGLLRPEVDTAQPPEPPGSAKDEDDIPSVGSVLDFGEAGAYTLEERLGRGGMGEVYRARQVGAKGFSQNVAIKRLRANSRPWEARSFVEEARVLSRLHHENIARVYGFLELDGSHYLVMEHIEGQTLHALLELARRKGYRFPEPIACEVMAEVADALSYAHHATDEAGKPLQVVHRDVSPSNILITDTGRAVLVDFGVALSNVEGRTATRSGFIKGKAPYLSPEQVKHLPLDARSDLFSVGTILVEMLTGRAPFGSTAELVTLYRVAAVTPEYVAALLPGVSPQLRAICQKLLASRPEQRFTDGCEVRKALRRHAGLYEGPPAVQRAVAQLQALPDAQPQPAPAELPALREVKRSRRLVTQVGLLAFVCLFASWYVASRYIALPASTPQTEPTMPQTKSPEQPVAVVAPVPSPPAVVEPEDAGSAEASPAPPPDRTPARRVFPPGSCGAFLSLASVVAISACHPRVPTGTKAGDCDFIPDREAMGLPIPKELAIKLISINGKRCTGQKPEPYASELGYEPCPAEDGEIVVQISLINSGPFVGKLTYDTAPYLYGTARVVPVKGGEKVTGVLHGLQQPRLPLRDSVARLTALFTQMQMHDGTRLKICGVLFDPEWRIESPKLNGEGVPVLDSKYYGAPATPTWTLDEYVRMYYPPSP